MTPQPYQNAYDTAVSELTEIAAKFEQLRARKLLIENAIHALEPFFASGEEASATMGSDESASQPVLLENDAATADEPEAYSFQDVPSPLPDISETGGDPFQRRVKSGGYRFRGFATRSL